MIRYFVGAQRNFVMRGFDLFLWCEDSDGNLGVADAPAYSRVESSDLAAPVAPALTMRMEAAQALLDDLYNAGLRPTHAVDAPGATNAQQAHIADLRAVLFKLMDREDDRARSA